MSWLDGLRPNIENRKIVLWEFEIPSVVMQVLQVDGELIRDLDKANSAKILLEIESIKFTRMNLKCK